MRKIAFLLLAAGLGLAGTVSGEGPADAVKAKPVTPTEVGAQAAGGEPAVAVAAPPFSEGIFPCSQCHDGKDVDVTRRELEAHTEIVLHHDEHNRWCLDCHDAKNRDKLHSASGELIDFSESYRLCGQCHGDKLRDWRKGIHGKRTGSWSGKKQYLLCASCHDPHSPRFKQMRPEPPPARPDSLR